MSVSYCWQSFWFSEESHFVSLTGLIHCAKCQFSCLIAWIATCTTMPSSLLAVLVVVGVLVLLCRIVHLPL